MIRSLRKKFIIFAMAAVTVLLLVLGLAINGLSWFMFEQQADAVINELINSDGKFMRKDDRRDSPPPREPFTPDMNAMRTSRFFIVEMETDGDFVDVDIEQVFYVDETEARELAMTAVSQGRQNGRIGNFRYAVREKDDDEVLICFLDVTRENLTMRTILFVSVVIAAASWLIVLVFVVLLSGRVVQPIIQGFEKQKQFITDAGHELKTPLAIIKTNNDAMSLIHGENKYNRNIAGQVTRLSELTSNLLMQARLDEERELEKETVNISDLCTEILQPYGDGAENRGLYFEKRIAPEIMLQVNRAAFTQLITLLMDNALKYTPDSGRIRFELTKSYGHVVIIEENICDPEMDVDPERLFERFYRADSARTQTDKHSGYGIGLSVARGICENHGGRLTAEYPQKGLIRFTARF